MLVNTSERLFHLIRAILSPALYIASVVLASAVPAYADRWEYLECFDRCKAMGSQNSCFANCDPYMSRPGPPPLPTSAFPYGAIALDDDVLRFGYAKNEPSREAAEAHATAECRRAGGSADGCKVIIWRHNSCVALATSQEGSQGKTWGYSYSDEGILARREAMKLCRNEGGTNCQIAVSFCSG